MTQITTTVTFDDLIATYENEIGDLREGYDDAVALARERFGEDALDRPLPPDADDDELQDLATLRMTATAYEESAKQIQNRINALEILREEYNDEPFEFAWLLGEELLDVETELKGKARERGVEKQEVEHHRKGVAVDAACVGAPEGVPRETVTDDDGNEYETPTPSKTPNPLMLSLYEHVETYSNAGATDFRAPGFDDGRDLSPAPAVSDTPTPSSEQSSASDSTGETIPDSGDS